eukprot:6883995-Prymnesium_polylepis.2
MEGRPGFHVAMGAVCPLCTHTRHRPQGARVAPRRTLRRARKRTDKTDFVFVGFHATRPLVSRALLYAHRSWGPCSPWLSDIARETTGHAMP